MISKYLSYYIMSSDLIVMWRAWMCLIPSGESSSSKKMIWLVAIWNLFPNLISYFKDETFGCNSKGLPLSYGMGMKMVVGIVLLRLVRSAIPA
ncbi:hypothetical protein ACB092_05G177000 [Castanea dentata]